jgi:hypothetical protein
MNVWSHLAIGRDSALRRTIRKYLILVAVAMFLVSVVLWLGQQTGGGSPQQQATQEVYRDIARGLARFHTQYGYYPPHVAPEAFDASAAPTTAPFLCDRPGEVLYWYISDYITQSDATRLARDTDGDTLREFVDTWGNPIGYRAPRHDLAPGSPEILADRLTFDHREAISFDGNRGRDHREYYDLWSIGPDHVNDTHDDLCNWFPGHLD